MHYNREEELATTAELVPIPHHGAERHVAVDYREAASRPVSAAPGINLAGTRYAHHTRGEPLDRFPPAGYSLSSTHPPAGSQRRPYSQSPERSTLYSSPVPADTTLPPPSWQTISQPAHQAAAYTQVPHTSPPRPDVPATPPYTPRAHQHHDIYHAAPHSNPHSGQSGTNPSPPRRLWQHSDMQADYRPSSPPETLQEVSPGASYAISDMRRSGGSIGRGRVRASGSSSGVASPLQQRLENQVRDLERYNHSLEKRVRDLGQELREVQEHSYSIQAQLQRCQEVLSERDTQVQRVTGERDELSLRLQEREAFISSQEHALQELVQSRDHLKQQQAQLQDVMHDSRTQAETSLKKMEGYNERLERMSTEACRERDAALQKIEEILEDMKELHNKFEESQGDNQKMARLLVSLGKDRDEQKETVETLRKRVDGLTRDLADAQNDLDSALRDAAKAEDYAVKHARSAAELQARLDAAERTERRDRDLIDDLQRANDELLQSLRARRNERRASRAPSPAAPAVRHAWEDERPVTSYPPRHGRIADDAPVRRSLEAAREPLYRSVHAHAGPSDVESFAGSYRRFLEEAPAHGSSYERLGKPPQRTSPEYHRSHHTPPRGEDSARPPRDSPELLPPGPLAHHDLQRLEGMLLNLNLEKDQLTAEYDKMPTHGGRTLAQRQRKSELEARLSDIDKEISQVRLSLKKKGYR